MYRRTADALPPPLKGPNVTVAPATIDAMSWLVGDWAGTVAANTVEERWMAAAGGATDFLSTKVSADRISRSSRPRASATPRFQETWTPALTGVRDT